jgi:VIT1/CCC1 family predicted Fe2+/Mn2+ transporter
MHLERHSIESVGWLRAAVLGANDGIVSTASLVLGVASANTSPSGVLLAGVAGLVAGAMSMATGEYVSVSSQADTETAALAEEKVSWTQIIRRGSGADVSLYPTRSGACACPPGCRATDG